MNKRIVILMVFIVLAMSSFTVLENPSSSFDVPAIGNESFYVAAGESWLTGWDFRKSITITGVAGAGADYPIEFDVNYGGGADSGNSIFTWSECQTDFDDIRFTDDGGSTELDYYIREYGASGDAEVWVEVSDSLASNQVIYIYYGNAGASTTSNGDNTFYFFDDFEDNDLSEWGATGSWAINTGTVRYGARSAYGVVGAGSLATPVNANNGANFTDDFVLDFWARSNDDDKIYVLRATSDEGTGYDAVAQGNDIQYYDGSYHDYGGSDQWNPDTWYHMEFYGDMDASADTWTLVMNDNELTSNPKIHSTGDGNVAEFQRAIHAPHASYSLDDLFLDSYLIRQWNSAGQPYPSSYGSEEESIPVNSGWSLDNADDTDNLYARYKKYEVTGTVTHAAGYAYVDTVKLYFEDSGAVDLWAFVYDVDLDTFSETLGYTYIELVTADCTDTGAGTTWNLKFVFYIEWAHDEKTNYRFYVLSEDDSTKTDGDIFDATTDVETRLDEGTAYSISDGAGVITRGDVNKTDGITSGGSIVYYGSSLHPPVDEIDVYVTNSNFYWGNAWHQTAYEASGGTFATTMDSSDVVLIYDNKLKVVVDGNDGSGTQLLHNTPDINYISDRINFTAAVSDTWVWAGESITVTLDATYEYDASAVPSPVWSIADSGTVSYATAGTRTWFGVSSGDTYGITVYTNVSASCTWDDVEISSVAYTWMQYSPDAVWLLWNPSTFQWAANSSAIADGSKIQLKMNNTNDDYGYVFGGTMGDLAIGEFDTSWFYVNITAYYQGGGMNRSIWSMVLRVDILHSIHIEVQQFYLTDNWVIINIQTNWNNATFFVWDNVTGTPQLVGASYEGSYPFARSAVVGLHNLIVLVNGSHGTLVSTSQVAGTVDTNSWEYLQFPYTVNPVAFSITDPYAMQNNVSIIFSALFYTSDLSLVYTIYEDNIWYQSGTVNIPSSGSFYVLRWDKSSVTSVANWTVVLRSSTTNITIYGYNFIIDSSNYNYYYSSGGLREGDIYVIGDSELSLNIRAQDSMWEAVGTLFLILTLPVVVGIAVKMDRARARPRGKRQKENDKHR